jgi:type I restriction enzyme S subunit
MMFYKETNFKETEIGGIPKDWEIKELEKVSILIRSGTTPLKSKKEYWNGNILFVTQADMTKVDRYLYETSEKITELGLKSSNLFIVPENSVLLSMYGTIGKVIINKVPVAISQNIAAIILNKEKVNEEYLHYALQTYSSQFKRQAKTITLRHLDIKIVKKILIPLPSLQEQQKIAEILSTVDGAIQKNNEIITKTERLKKGLMQKLLTKGIGHKEFKDTEVGRIPKEWEVVKLGDVLLLLRNGLTARQNKEGNGYPVTRIETISEEKIDLSKLGYVSGLSEKDVENYRLIEGDILFSHINSLEHIGKTAIYEGVPRFLLHGMNLLLLRPDKNKIYPIFLLYLLRLFREKKIFEAMSKRAVNQASINQTELRNLKIFLPSLPEQQKIAEVLSTVDKKLELERNEKAKLEKIKQGLMDLLLTGKIRVKVN